MNCPCSFSIWPAKNPAEAEKNDEHAKLVMVALSAVALFLILAGTLLIYVSTWPSIMHDGFGFVYQFIGIHCVILGVLVATIGTIATACLRNGSQREG